MKHIFYASQKSLWAYSNKIPRCLRKKLEMFVIRVNAKGNLVNSKPCNSCIYYMQLYGIKSVYYSDENGEIVREKLLDIQSSHLSISQDRYYQFLETGDKKTIMMFSENYRKRTRKEAINEKRGRMR